MRRNLNLIALILVAAILAASSCAGPEEAVSSGELPDDEIENIVRRSYQYVARADAAREGMLVSHTV